MLLCGRYEERATTQKQTKPFCFMNHLAFWLFTLSCMHDLHEHIFLFHPDFYLRQRRSACFLRVQQNGYEQAQQIKFTAPRHIAAHCDVWRRIFPPSLFTPIHMLISYCVISYFCTPFFGSSCTTSHGTLPGGRRGWWCGKGGKRSPPIILITLIPFGSSCSWTPSGFPVLSLSVLFLFFFNLFGGS